MSPYYNPEKHGLEILACVQWGEPCWDFDMTVLWREKDTGNLYIASDSGCSCPLPFEGYCSVSDLEPVKSLADVQARTRDSYPDESLRLIQAYMGAK